MQSFLAQKRLFTAVLGSEKVANPVFKAVENRLRPFQIVVFWSMVGFSYLLTLDVSLSLWFFFLFYKFQCFIDATLSFQLIGSFRLYPFDCALLKFRLSQKWEMSSYFWSSQSEYLMATQPPQWLEIVGTFNYQILGLFIRFDLSTKMRPLMRQIPESRQSTRIFCI